MISPPAVRRAAVLFVAMSFSLSGCTAKPDTPDPTTETRTEMSATNSSVQETSTRQISIVHALGTTKLDAPAQTIVALDDPWADAVLMLHGTLVGYADTHAQGATLGNYLGGLLDEYGADAQVIGTPREPDFEMIAALKPDLIVGTRESSGEYYDRLSEIAPTVMSEGAPTTWKSGYLVLGKAMGAEPEAAALLAEYEKQARRIGDEINVKSANPTISVVRFQNGPTRIFANASFPGMVLTDAGLSRPKSQRGTQNFIKITADQVDAVAADRIFMTMSPLGGERSLDSFRATPQWTELDQRTVIADDAAWITSESLPGAYAILAELARAFDVSGPVVPDELKPR
ncbi:ABC transporter substrate-binding protein [Corynebacterium sp. CCM 9204]|uniref:ABC transporter substrate-binding protein n=1 Tax=Corynebacterium sp. CCM 9204 TaxID=3057616 RepID=UPI003525E5A1